jgi:ribosome-binding protein aMBF1 (putative translation factor)
VEAALERGKQSPVQDMAKRAEPPTEETCPNELRKVFGEHVRQARISRGLSQREAAEQIGILFRNLGRIERGDVNVT